MLKNFIKQLMELRENIYVIYVCQKEGIQHGNERLP